MIQMGTNYANKEIEERENRIEARLSSLHPLKNAIYNELCRAKPVSTTYSSDFDEKKRIRAKKISEHMPKLLAFLGFNNNQLNVIIGTYVNEDYSYDQGIIRLTEWMNDILKEGGGKWR